MMKLEKKYFLFLAALILSVFGLWFIYQSLPDKEKPVIRDYEESDFLAVRAIMEQNRFWLSKRKNFSPERLLTTRAPYDDMTRKGQVKIKVLLSHGTAAGFIAYYKKTSEEGVIYLIAVDEKFRGQGFGYELMQAALAELKKARATYVTLATRSINEPAKRLYQSLGFEKVSEEDGSVLFIRRNL